MEKTKTLGCVTAALEQGLLRPASAVAAVCDPAATRRFPKIAAGLQMSVVTRAS